MMTPAITEFIGTSLLVGAFVFGTPMLVVAALAIAISWGGRVSGGHFNPAITASQLFMGKMSHSRAMAYFIAQIGAGVFIGLLSKAF